MDEITKEEQHWKDELDKWQKRMTFMRKYFDEAKKRHGWENFIKFLWGKVSQAISIHQTVVMVNDIYAYLKTSVASLYSKNPYIAVNPKKAAEIQSAIIKEQLVNYRWKELELKRYVKKAIQEAKLVGHSWIKLGYEAEINEEPVKDVDGNIVKGEVRETIVGEHIWGIHVPYNEIYYDHEAKDAPYDCRWIEHHYLKPVAWLENKYGIKGIDATHKPEDNDDGKYQKELPESDIQMTMVHEIWDKDDGYKKIYCEGWDDWLEKTPPASSGCIGPYALYGFPFKMLKFNDFPSPDGKDNFPMSDIEAWLDQFLEKIKLRSAQLDHVKRYNRQVLYDKNKVAATDMENFIKGVTGSNIGVDGDPNTIMAAAPAPNIPPDAYAVENKIDIDRDKISGLPGFEQGGIAVNKTRTLGELDKISAGADNRRMEQVDIVEDFCCEIAKGLLCLEKQFSDIEKITRVVGDIPKEVLEQLSAAGKFDGQSITYTKEDIQGDEDVDIKAGSALPMNKENRIATCIQIMRFGPAIGLVPGSMAAMELGKIIMKDMDLLTVEKAYMQDMASEVERRNKPNPAEMLKQKQMEANLNKTAVDVNLKQQRVTATNLANVAKAINNARELNGKTEQPANEV